jgi:hypothetical protein
MGEMKGRYEYGYAEQHLQVELDRDESSKIELKHSQNGQFALPSPASNLRSLSSNSLCLL